MLLHDKIDQLITAIRDPENPNSLTSNALGVLGRSAQSAVPELIKIATNNEATIYTRVQAIRTIGVIQEPRGLIVPALIDFLKNGDLLSRIYSARALANMPVVTAEIIEALSDSLSDVDSNVCRNAALSLAYLGESAVKAVPVLIENLQREDIAGEIRETLIHIDPSTLPDGNAVESSYLFPSCAEIEWDPPKRTAFSDLTESILSLDGNQPIVYNLPYPKWEYLFYLTRYGEFILHGSANKNMDCLSPKQSPGSLGEFGSQQAVFGTGDGILAMYYAILDRNRIRGMDNGFFVERGSDGKPIRFYELAIDAASLTEQPWVDGTIYILPAMTFEPDERSGENTVQFASRESVKPVAKLPVSPMEFPFLDWMSGFDAQAPCHRGYLLGDSTCLRDIQYRPIRKLYKM